MASNRKQEEAAKIRGQAAEQMQDCKNPTPLGHRQNKKISESPTGWGLFQRITTAVSALLDSPFVQEYPSLPLLHYTVKGAARMGFQIPQKANFKSKLRLLRCITGQLPTSYLHRRPYRVQSSLTFHPGWPWRVRISLLWYCGVRYLGVYCILDLARDSTYVNNNHSSNHRGNHLKNFLLKIG